MRKYLPERLFKYTCVRHESGLANDPFILIRKAESIFRDKVLYFSSPRQFNDPFEFQLPGEFKIEKKHIISSTLKSFGPAALKDPQVLRFLTDDDYANAALEQLNRDQRLDCQRFVETLSVLCLSAVCDHPMMWSHYADQHKGICIEFDFKRHHLSENIANVAYRKDRPLGNLFTTPTIEWSIHLAYTKFRCWRYEKEYRSVRVGAAGLVPFPALALKRVILGCRIGPDDRKVVEEWVRDYGSPIELCEAQTVKDKFELKIVPAKRKASANPLMSIATARKILSQKSP